MEVEVEGLVGAVPKGGFHARGVGVGGPAVVDGVCDGEKPEGDVGGGVGAVENGELEKREKGRGGEKVNGVRKQ